MRVHTSAACLKHAAPQHPERPERLTAALAGASGAQIVEAEPIDLALVRAVHADALVERVQRGGWIDADTFVMEHSWEAALRSAGAAVAAARDALAGKPAFAITRPPGHHATRGSPMGFCLFNNVAIAAHELSTRGTRVAIVDIDVHHGNGTQDIFWKRSDVLYASLHGWPLYPGTGRVEEVGAGETLNLPCPSGTGDEGWLECVREGVVPKLQQFAPDVTLISAGFDADARDPLGNLALTPRVFHEAVRLVATVQPRVAAVLEGGYDLRAVEDGVREVGRALDRQPSGAPEIQPGGPRPWADLEARVRALHALPK